MLNLLIREDRHAIRGEYLKRFLLVVEIFIVALLLIWGTILFSLHVIVDIEAKIIKNDLENLRNSSDLQSMNNLIALNNDVQDKISQFEIHNFKQSDVMAEILSKQQSGVGLNLININLNLVEEEIFATVEIRGVSATRNDLVGYQKKLSESKLFTNVDIPFSSFAQNSQMPFVVNLKTTDLNKYFNNEN